MNMFFFGMENLTSKPHWQCPTYGKLCGRRWQGVASRFRLTIVCSLYSSVESTVRSDTFFHRAQTIEKTAAWEACVTTIGLSARLACDERLQGVDAFEPI